MEILYEHELARRRRFMKGKLVFEDGQIFEGELLEGIQEGITLGEVVFNTAMVGYQESITDPSYCGQLLTMTYPLIGNYGTNKRFMQSNKPYISGLIIGELCEEGSNWQLEQSLASFLGEYNITCIYNVDTRAVTRKIRSNGAMKGIIVKEAISDEEIKKLLARELRKDVVSQVTTKETYVLDSDSINAPHIVAMDFGIKQSIVKSLHSLGAKVTVVPAKTKAKDILDLLPDGIFLSNGPGDPEAVLDVVEEIKKLLGKKPIFGICLGHQLLSLAFGAKTYKMKFGHRGANQPVKNIITGRVQITSQNHGYAVDANSLQSIPVEITHINVNDGTIEGIRHKHLPIFSVQYHPEASPGPDDNKYLFDEFWAMMRGE